MNIPIIEKFFSENYDHLIINVIDDKILAFYIYLLKIFSIKYKSQIVNQNSSEIGLANPDLFNNNRKIYLIETNSNKEIQNIIKLNKKLIVFTDYKNFKAFSKQALSINSYNYAEDIKVLVHKIYGIKSDILIKNIIANPEYCYSEMEKFIVNNNNYPSFDVNENNDNDKIALIRKSVYKLKKNNELLDLFNLLKLEALNKKFSFLAY